MEKFGKGPIKFRGFSPCERATHPHIATRRRFPYRLTARDPDRTGDRDKKWGAWKRGLRNVVRQNGASKRLKDEQDYRY